MCHAHVPTERPGSSPWRAPGTSPQREGLRLGRSPEVAEGGGRRVLAVCSEPRRTVRALRRPESTRSLTHSKLFTGGQAAPC